MDDDAILGLVSVIAGFLAFWHTIAAEAANGGRVAHSIASDHGTSSWNAKAVNNAGGWPAPSTVGQVAVETKAFAALVLVLVAGDAVLGITADPAVVGSLVIHAAVGTASAGVACLGAVGAEVVGGAFIKAGLELIVTGALDGGSVAGAFLAKAVEDTAACVPVGALSDIVADSAIVHEKVGHIPFVREPAHAASVDEGALVAGGEPVGSLAVGGAVLGGVVAEFAPADATLVLVGVKVGGQDAITASINNSGVSSKNAVTAAINDLEVFGDDASGAVVDDMGGFVSEVVGSVAVSLAVAIIRPVVDASPAVISDVRGLFVAGVIVLVFAVLNA